MKFKLCESTDAHYHDRIRKLVRQGEILPAIIPNNASSWQATNTKPLAGKLDQMLFSKIAN